MSKGKINTPKEILKYIEDNNIKFIDFRFTDILSKWHHFTLQASAVNENTFLQGITFDGSSISGGRNIHKSDLIILPDITTISHDPFFAAETITIICDMVAPNNQSYSCCPRSIAKKAEEYLKESKIGDNFYVGPEIEFFIFDNVKYNVEPYNVGFNLFSTELPCNNISENNLTNTSGHTIKTKSGYSLVPPQDSSHEIRNEMLSALNSMGVIVEKHHHEVASAQHEIVVKFNSLNKIADSVQIYKYCIQQVAHSFGKTATFMPKPVYGDNGSGMHINQSIFKNGENIFKGEKNAGLSQECLWYIGGLIKHGKALNAFANPTTNSYKRLVPNYEAPTILAYSQHNRSTSFRIPHSFNNEQKRIEARFPDPTANPYLTFAAMLMAGIDGINNKIDPGTMIDKNLYSLSLEEVSNMPTVCSSLKEALENLDKDREFLKQNNVFNNEIIDAFITLKYKEVEKLEITPHPVEFDMYYSS